MQRNDAINDMLLTALTSLLMLLHYLLSSCLIHHRYYNPVWNVEDGLTAVWCSSEVQPEPLTIGLHTA